MPRSRILKLISKAARTSKPKLRTVSGSPNMVGLILKGTLEGIS
jgi:hypothetical protein